LQEAIINSPFDSHFKTSLQHQWIMARSLKNIKTNIETGVKTESTVAANRHYYSMSEYSEPISKTKKYYWRVYIHYMPLSNHYWWSMLILSTLFLSKDLNHL
jgi:hypothetical protein